MRKSSRKPQRLPASKVSVAGAKPALGGAAGPDLGEKTAGGQGTNFSDRNLLGTSPLTEEFLPTEGKAIRQRKQMGGLS